LKNEKFSDYPQENFMYQEPMEKCRQAQWHIHRTSKNTIGIQVVDVFTTPFARYAEKYFYNKEYKSPFKTIYAEIFQKGKSLLLNSNSINHVFIPKK
ncbi:MAG: hypothetical protein J7J68_05165, partial [Thermotogaceae bacterium]|nr:hypothetical protein [Thermotogaceae bacterium]